MSSTRGRPGIMFLYWGRRGSLARLAFQVGRAALADGEIRPTISVSRQNECFHAYREFGSALFPIETFSGHSGAISQSWRIPILRRRLSERLHADQIQAVITLMPHVWTPLVAPIVRRAGVRYVTIVHDADPHPGDPTGLVHGWALRDLSHADLVLTLSEAVAGRLVAAGRVPREKLCTLFHPDLVLGPPAAGRPPGPDEPFRLLFLGRVLPYKGLGLLLDAVDLLRAEGIAVELGVFGEGSLAPFKERLRALGAEVVNRWLSNEEIGAVLTRYHAVALSHVAASQSGVAAAAFGSGLPVVATPVGGLREQVEEGRTGLLAESANAPAFAAAVKALISSPGRYHAICQHLRQSRDRRSTERFVRDVSDRILKIEPPPQARPGWTAAVKPLRPNGNTVQILAGMHGA